MRSQNLFLLGVCVVVVTAIFFFTFIRSTPQNILAQLGARLTRQAPVVAAPEEPPAEPKKSEPAKRNRMAGSATRTTEEPAVSPVASVPVPERPPAPPMVHPGTADIPVGMARGTLLSRFPRPALQTSTLRDGDLIELIVYQKDDERLATFAQLENGAVTRVYAGVAPQKMLR